MVYTEANRNHWPHTSHSDLQNLLPVLLSREDFKSTSEPWQFQFSSAYQLPHAGLGLDSEDSFFLLLAVEK